jgi:S-formylglutathione hydrolase
MTNKITKVADHRAFGGAQQRFRHTSQTLNCDMHFSVFLPPQVDQGHVPVLYWLSGLTCTDENFVQKAGAQRAAAEHGIAIVCPDTSPRGAGIPDDSEGAYDFGLGAGFYLDATQPPWAKHYQMYSYCTRELPEIVAQQFPIDGARVGISGHSMGGHGALTIALKNPDHYTSVSAFAPICAPTQCAWGKKALQGYMGDATLWERYDTSALIKSGARKLPMRIEQGENDEFLSTQLCLDVLEQVCYEQNYPVDIHRHAGYDHSYFFIASYIDEHIAFHAHHLNNEPSKQSQ